MSSKTGYAVSPTLWPKRPRNNAPLGVPVSPLSDAQEKSDAAKESRWRPDCAAAKRTHLLRFAGLCLVAIVILCAVYGLRGGSKHHDQRRYSRRWLNKTKPTYKATFYCSKNT